MLEEKIDLLITAVERLIDTLEGRGQVPLPEAATPKAKGKKAKEKAAEPEVVTEEEEDNTEEVAEALEEATDVTSEPEGEATIGDINELVKQIATTVEEGEDAGSGRKKVLAIYAKYKVTTSASLKPKDYAEVHRLLKAEI